MVDVRRKPPPPPVGLHRVPSATPSYARLMALPAEAVCAGRSPSPPRFVPLRCRNTVIEWTSEDEDGTTGGGRPEAGVEAEAEERWEALVAQQSRPLPPPRMEMRLWKDAPSTPAAEQVTADMGSTQLLRVAKAVNQQSERGESTEVKAAQGAATEGGGAVRRSAAVQTAVPAAAVEEQGWEAELKRMRAKVALYITGQTNPAPSLSSFPPPSPPPDLSPPHLPASPLPLSSARPPPRPSVATPRTSTSPAAAWSSTRRR